MTVGLHFVASCLRVSRSVRTIRGGRRLPPRRPSQPAARLIFPFAYLAYFAVADPLLVPKPAISFPRAGTLAPGRATHASPLHSRPPSRSFVLHNSSLVTSCLLGVLGDLARGGSKSVAWASWPGERIGRTAAGDPHYFFDNPTGPGDSRCCPWKKTPKRDKSLAPRSGRTYHGGAYVNALFRLQGAHGRS